MAELLWRKGHKLMFKKATALFIYVALSSLAQGQLNSYDGTGVFITDRFGYSGSIIRYASLSDARNGVNSLDTTSVSNRDLSVYVVNNTGADQMIVMESWYYTAEDGSRDISGAGFLQLSDSSAEDVSIGFHDMFTKCTLSLRGDGAGGRFSTANDMGGGCDTGRFLEYELDISAGGLNGVSSLHNPVDLGGGILGMAIVAEAYDHPGSGSGSIEGIFENTNSICPEFNGFYVFDLSISMSNWAYANAGDFQDSYFITEVLFAGYTLGVSSSAGGGVFRNVEDIGLVPVIEDLVFQYNDPVELIAQADPDHRFAHWEVDGVAGVTDNPLSLAMDTNHTVRAIFKTDETEIVVTPDPEIPIQETIIQDTVDTVEDEATIHVPPGTYGTVELSESSGDIVLVGADPGDPIEEYPVLQGDDINPAVTFDSVDANTVLSGFIITAGEGCDASGILCENGSPTIRNCLIVGNRSLGNPYGAGAVLCINSNAVFENCTFADNLSGIYASAFSCVNSNPIIRNSIIWGNGWDGPADPIGPPSPNISTDELSEPIITYCNIEGGWPGEGNLDIDPLFVLPGIWDNGTWIEGDYHLAVGSPCIDAGDPSTPVGFEPEPNGGRINLGVYGGTADASLSPPAGE